jgi:hypothetical protein
MTLQDLGSIGELIGAVATVAMLIYRALQIRQNSSLLRQNVSALELTALDQSYRYGADFRALLLQDEGLGDLWRRGCSERDSLTKSELMRFGLLAESLFLGNQAIWTRRIAGPAPVPSEDIAMIATLLTQPGLAEWWARNRSRLHPEYVQALENAKTAVAGNP